MDKNEEIQFALNEMRLIVLQEWPDGKFHQVMLTAEQFKKVSHATIAHRDPANFEIVSRHFNSDWDMDADNFLGLASIYSDEEVKCDQDTVQ